MSVEELIGLLKTIATFLGVLAGVVSPVIVWLANKWRKAEDETKTLLNDNNVRLLSDNARLQKELQESHSDATDRAERYAETAATYARIIENLRNNV